MATEAFEEGRAEMLSPAVDSCGCSAAVALNDGFKQLELDNAHLRRDLDAAKAANEQFGRTLAAIAKALRSALPTGCMSPPARQTTGDGATEKTVKDIFDSISVLKDRSVKTSSTSTAVSAHSGSGGCPAADNLAAISFLPRGRLLNDLKAANKADDVILQQMQAAISANNNQDVKLLGDLLIQEVKTARRLRAEKIDLLDEKLELEAALSRRATGKASRSSRAAPAAADLPERPASAPAAVCAADAADAAELAALRDKTTKLERAQAELANVWPRIDAESKAAVERCAALEASNRALAERARNQLEAARADGQRRGDQLRAQVDSLVGRVDSDKQARERLVGALGRVKADVAQLSAAVGQARQETVGLRQAATDEMRVSSNRLLSAAKLAAVEHERTRSAYNFILTVVEERDRVIADQGRSLKRLQRRLVEQVVDGTFIADRVS